MSPVTNKKPLSPVSASSSIPAPLWRRFTALFYDAFLLAFGVFPFAALLVFALFKALAPEAIHSNGYTHIIQLVIFIFAVLFYWLFYRKNGQTLGMQTWKVKLVYQSQSPEKTSPNIRFSTVLIRCLVATLTCGLGFLTAFFHKDKRNLLDLASRTQCITYTPEA